LNILDRFVKDPQISNLMKIWQVVAKLFHADGETDKMKLVVTLRNFADMYNNHKT
jgi:hypothetical protein